MFDVTCQICKTFITQESQEESGGGGIVSVAKMIDDRTFWYGLSGVFIWKVDLGLHKDDSICNDCLEKHKDDIEPFKSIPCSTCDELYQPTWEETTTQGWGCSSYVYEKDGMLKINGGWGSKHDLTVYDVKDAIVKVGDRLCDKCVDKFVEKGIMVENRDESGYAGFNQKKESDEE